MAGSLTNWLVPLDEDTREKLVTLSIKEYEIPENAVVIENAYATDVALGVHLLLDTDFVVNHPSFVKQIIGHLLRILGDLADNSGHVLPVIGFIETKGNNDKAQHAKEKIEQLAGDQDWHRGDFSLMLLDENAPEQMMRKLLSDAATVWEDVEPLKPLSHQEYAERLKAELEDGVFSEVHESLLSLIEKTLRKDELDVLDGLLYRWLDDWFQEAETVMGVI